ncbi:MAG: glucose-6-phosphate isomerase [Patescibacteria group bacterium]
MPLLSIDDRGFRPLDSRRRKSMALRLKRAKEAVIKQAEDGEQGWFFLPDDREMLKRVRTAVEDLRGFTDLLVIGIGGSDLGARALSKALVTEKTNGLRLHFAGANTDPDELSSLLKQLDLKKTAINIISKSGDTVEPMTTFLIVREALIKAVGKSKAASHIIATTDAQSGSLRMLADEEGYVTLPVAGNVGGRFSVLTDVGLFPLAAAGIEIDAILKGAKTVRDSFVREAADKNDACAFAASQFAYAEEGKRIQILMPYAERLREVGFWYRQIWAESLGKKTNRKGKIVHVGPTPIAALGATDQHSQIQLYTEGPDDKTVTFIEVDSFSETLHVPKSVSAIKPLAYLAGTSLERIIHAEREATAKALTLAGCPNATIHLSSVSPETMGALVMFFELATGISGELYDINAYDQPGVEAGKHAMKKILSK